MGASAGNDVRRPGGAADLEHLAALHGPALLLELPLELIDNVVRPHFTLMRRSGRDRNAHGGGVSKPLSSSAPGSAAQQRAGRRRGGAMRRALRASAA